MALENPVVCGVSIPKKVADAALVAAAFEGCSRSALMRKLTTEFIRSKYPLLLENPSLYADMMATDAAIIVEPDHD